MRANTKNTITAAMARDLGLAPITASYTRKEADLLERAAAHLERDKIDFALVKTRDGIAIWRKGKTTGVQFGRTYGDVKVSR